MEKTIFKVSCVQDPEDVLKVQSESAKDGAYLNVFTVSSGKISTQVYLEVDDALKLADALNAWVLEQGSEEVSSNG